MRITYKAAILLTVLTTLSTFTSCKPKIRENVTSETNTEKKVNVPVFNADTAYSFIEQQLAFGPRVPNTKAHRECGDWIVKKLQQYNAVVTEQNANLRAYDGTNLKARNIIGSFNPDERSRVLLCAHWDSRPWADHDSDPANLNKPVPAANDGASGVAVLLEIARLMSIDNPGLGVDIVLFDAEDYGEPQDQQGYYADSWALGSQYWAANPHVPNYSARYGILLDMVGAKGAVFTKEQYSRQFAPNIVRKVWQTAERLGYNNLFVNKDSGPVTDDHYYVNQLLRIPTIDIIDYSDEREKGFFEYWHTIDDTIEQISRETLKGVGQTVITVVYESA